MARRPIKHTAIIQALRARIVSGEFGPGSVLPNRETLQHSYRASRATIQQVFDELQSDGFVTTNGRGGTAVVPRPPHLHRIALVFPPAHHYGNRFWSALDNEARAMAQRGEREVVIHTGVAAGPDSPAYRQLLSEVESQRLAGLIFAALPDQLANSPIWSSSIAKVVIRASSGAFPEPSIYPDQHSFVQRAIASLAGSGCRRIAALVVENFPVDGLRRELAAAGLESAAHLIQAVPLSDPGWAKPLVQLLFNADQRVQPDGLVICDDNLVEHALAGLDAARVRVPEAVQVVAHCNFPWPVPSVLPVRRLGFDTGEVLRACLAQLDRRRAGQATDLQTTIAAHFEDETTSAVSA